MKALLLSSIGSLLLLGGCTSMGEPGHGMHGAARNDMHADCPMMENGPHGGREGGAMREHGAANCPMAQEHTADAPAASHDHTAPAPN